MEGDKSPGPGCLSGTWEQGGGGEGAELGREGAEWGREGQSGCRPGQDVP